MRLAVAFIAAIAWAVCASASAQRPEGFEPAAEADVAALRSCLADHRPDERTQCMRQMTRACVEASGPGGETTEGALVCTRREQIAWRAIMDESVAALRARESATQRILLDTALGGGEGWAAWLCAYDASYHEDAGALAQIRAAECHRDFAAERALFFYARFNDRDQ